MSCLSIRLPPAKKAWKSFTSKLQTRLHKLHKPKAMKKPKPKPKPNARLQTAVAKTSRPSLLLGQHLQRKRRRALPFGYRRYYVSKNRSAAPVYVDRLFKDTPELVGKIYQQPPEKGDVGIRGKIVGGTAAAEAGTSKEGEEVEEDKSGEGDEMWESMGMASPMLYGIDARAEEFIASFRAEMERQEIIARNLKS